jgi:hypothetical protein
LVRQVYLLIMNVRSIVTHDTGSNPVLTTKNKIMKRTFNEKEVEAMCTQSYMRGMMVQYENQTKVKKTKSRKVFVDWIKQIIDECPVNKFK